MNARSYYNEHDPKAAAWLRELIKEGHIAPGDVDERSITDVHPSDLTPYAQCHFFAGIGGWSLALRMAGVPDSRPIWTGSCPCQPFSDAGLGLGTADPRHLWPHFFRLIDAKRPVAIIGEQVASKAALSWFDGVCADLEGAGYACAAADLAAASVGAPHIRQRLFWLAYAGHEHAGRAARPGETESGRTFGEPSGRGDDRGLADAGSGRREMEMLNDGCRKAESGEREASFARGGRASCGLEHTEQPGLEGHAGNGDHRNEPGWIDANPAGSATPAGGAWDSFDLLPCLDGKARRVESGTFPLAHGVSGRVGLLRGYGNAIVPQVAAEFIQASLEAIEDLP